MRSVIFVSMLAAATAVAHASFEMLLIGDNTGNNFKVNRYDPISRVSLGSFGQGIINHRIADVAVDQARNKAFVLSEGGRVNVFNYNTGEWLGAGSNNSYNYLAIAYNPQSDTVTFGDGYGSGGSGGQAVLNGDLTPTGVGFSSVYVSTAPIQRPDSTNYFAYTLFGASPFYPSANVWNSGGGDVLYNIGSEAWNGTNGIRDSAFLGTTMYGLAFNSANGFTSLVSSATTTNFLAIPSTVATLGISHSSGSSRSLAVGHNGLMWMKIGNELRSYHPVNGFSAVNTLPGLAGDSAGMAIIVAPEPGSFAALAMGVLLLRRRNRKTQ